ncbi:MAG: type II toxin-antitoxin system VapC family toxin [Vulcanimicrobiota bacterium]
MKLLLDTHALLWALSTPERLSTATRLALEESSNELWISSVSFFEIATKVRNGKLPNPGPLLTNWDLTIARLNAGVLEVSVAQAILAGSLDLVHRDPFDRLLGAQAIERNLHLVTCDQAFSDFPQLKVLW